MTPALVLYLPLALIGFTAAVLRGVSLKQTDPKRRRALTAAWILIVLLGAPVWLFLAASMR